MWKYLVLSVSVCSLGKIISSSLLEKCSQFLENKFQPGWYIYSTNVRRLINEDLSTLKWDVTWYTNNRRWNELFISSICMYTYTCICHLCFITFYFSVIEMSWRLCPPCWFLLLVFNITSFLDTGHGKSTVVILSPLS